MTTARDYLTLPEAAEYSRLSVSSLRRAIGSRALPAARAGARIVLRREAVDAWLRSLEPQDAANPELAHA